MPPLQEVKSLSQSWLAVALLLHQIQVQIVALLSQLLFATAAMGVPLTVCGASFSLIVTEQVGGGSQYIITERIPPFCLWKFRPHTHTY